MKSTWRYCLRTRKTSSLGKLVLFLYLARERLYYLASVWGNLNLTLSFTRHHVCYKRLERVPRLWEEAQAWGWSPALKERLSLVRHQLKKTCRVFRREKREAKRWALIGWKWGWAGPEEQVTGVSEPSVLWGRIWGRIRTLTVVILGFSFPKL